MHLDNIRVSRKLWGMFLLLMLAMLAISAVAQYRTNANMARAMDSVLDIENRISASLRWRGATEASSLLAIDGVTTTDAVLARQFETRLKATGGDIDKIQQAIVADAKTPAEKAALEPVLAARKAVQDATAKALQLKSAGDDAATQKFANEQLRPLFVVMVKAQSDFADALTRQRDTVMVQADARLLQQSLEAMAMVLAVLLVFVYFVWKLVRSITLPMAQAGALIDAISNGDLTQELKTERKDEFGHMLRELSRMAQKLRSVVGNVRTGVEAVSLASNEIADGNRDLSVRTEQSASSLQQTAASMEELTATVTQSADTARQANQLAANAAKAATRGGEVVGQVVSSMEQISHSARKISDIIGVIDGIAFQTNILALNAAVEAARAGEQGRGFAVVASEVRSLAGRSAEAAKEIKQLIGTSVANVETGSRQVAEAGASMEEIVASVQRVTDLIGEITASSTEQRDGISQVNQAVTQLDQMTQQNAALVEQSTAAATALRDQAQHLTGVVSAFNVGATALTVRRTPAPKRKPAPPPRAIAAPAANAPRKLASAFPSRPAVGAQAAARKAPALAATPGRIAPPARAQATSASESDWESF